MKHLLKSVSPTDEDTFTIEIRDGVTLKYVTTRATVYEGPYAVVVILSELRENEGPSITNSAEYLYDYLLKRWSHKKPMFVFESYYDVFGDDFFSKVNYSVSKTPFKPYAVNWTYFATAQVESIIKSILEMKSPDFPQVPGPLP